MNCGRGIREHFSALFSDPWPLYLSRAQHDDHHIRGCQSLLSACTLRKLGLITLLDHIKQGLLFPLLLTMTSGNNKQSGLIQPLRILCVCVCMSMCAFVDKALALSQLYLGFVLCLWQHLSLFSSIEEHRSRLLYFLFLTRLEFEEGHWIINTLYHKELDLVSDLTLECLSLLILITVKKTETK